MTFAIAAIGAGAGYLAGGTAMAALAGAGIGATLSSVNASQRAANTQAQAAQQGIQAQEDALNRQISLNEPFRQAGIASQNRLMTLLGIRSPTATTGGGLFGGVGNAVSGAMGGGAGSEFVTDPNSPDFGKYARDFGATDFQTDPGYAFRLSEGMKALDRTAAARGGLLSGATLKGAEQYNQGLASQEYQNAFNRYQTNRANQLNPLMGYATGPGMSATSADTSAVGNFGNAANAGYTGAANARASGYVGSSNALTSALGTGLNYMQNQQLISRLPSSNSLGYGGLPSYGGGYSNYSSPDYGLYSSGTRISGGFGP